MGKGALPRPELILRPPGGGSAGLKPALEARISQTLTCGFSFPFVLFRRKTSCGARPPGPQPVVVFPPAIIFLVGLGRTYPDPSRLAAPKSGEGG
jgi:hypothetical protein